MNRPRQLAVLAAATLATTLAHAETMMVSAEERMEAERIFEELKQMTPPPELRSEEAKDDAERIPVTSSTNYQIPWDVQPGAAGIATSPSFALSATIGQNADSGRATSPSYVLDSGFQAPPDRDRDTLRDFLDNCVDAANPNQVDADDDGFGNACDADFNNDCIVNAVDLGFLRSVFFTNDAEADLNSDGIVNAVDLGIFRSLFFQPPGPSGIDNGC